MKQIRSKHMIAAGLTAGVAALGLLATSAVSSSSAGALSEPESESEGVEAGDKAPDFTLTDLEGKTHTLQKYLDQDKPVVLEWFNPDCPFVRKHHDATDSMEKTYKFAKENDAVWLAINSGAPGKQGAGLKRNKLAKENFGFEYPLLLDESGEVGLAYGATATPHMYVISAEGKIVYQGAIDSDDSVRSLGETNYVHEAFKSHLAGETVEVRNTESYGCSIKYPRK